MTPDSETEAATTSSPTLKNDIDTSNPQYAICTRTFTITKVQQEHPATTPAVAHPSPKEDQDNQDEKDPGDQGLIPHADSAVESVTELAKGVENAISGAVAWAEKKVDQLTSEDNNGVGPYASPATCIPSDLDPISSGVLPAMEATGANESKPDGSTESDTNVNDGKK